jgi:hypothetical protein
VRISAACSNCTPSPETVTSQVPGSIERTSRIIHAVISSHSGIVAPDGNTTTRNVVFTGFLPLVPHYSRAGGWLSRCARALRRWQPGSRAATSAATVKLAVPSREETHPSSTRESRRPISKGANPLFRKLGPMPRATSYSTGNQPSGAIHMLSLGCSSTWIGGPLWKRDEFRKRYPHIKSPECLREMLQKRRLQSASYTQSACMALNVPAR